ncbi:hypothetical protein M8C21_016135, partial [Ambrosia artemisiifolia]
MRKRIALGSARGLAYLHSHCDPKIIQHDVKAENILLDEKFEAVVGNFVLAKFMDYNLTHVSTNVCGTIGHIAPEICEPDIQATLSAMTPPTPHQTTATTFNSHTRNKMISLSSMRNLTQHKSTKFFDTYRFSIYARQLKRFSLFEIQVAMDNFNARHILGRGGASEVYKGRLADGTLVATKRLKEEIIEGGELRFKMELEIISMIVHCVASYLRANRIGSARRLAYLHSYCDPKIIHHDVKAENILQDAKFETVIRNFGLAKFMDYKLTHVSTNVCGTVGHIAPEYLSNRRSSKKTNVFGYGVVLLQLITGQRSFDLARNMNTDDVMLLDWVKGLLREKKATLSAMTPPTPHQITTTTFNSHTRNKMISLSSISKRGHKGSFRAIEEWQQTILSLDIFLEEVELVKFIKTDLLMLQRTILTLDIFLEEVELVKFINADWLLVLSHCDPKIIHHDVKAENILLDAKFEAVVGDFGLAKFMDYNLTHISTNVYGTIGHIAP